MKRESLKMQEEDFQRLTQVAAETSSIYRGAPSWRRLVLRIARGDVQCVGSPSPLAVLIEYLEAVQKNAERGAVADRREMRERWSGIAAAYADAADMARLIRGKNSPK